MGTLTFGATVVDLPDAMEWPNEFSYRGVVQKKTYGITGALLVESKAIQAGRQIELRSGERFGWLPREDVVTLCELANDAGAEGELEFRGQTFAVMFDQEDKPIEATPVIDYEDPDEQDFHVVTLRLIELPT